MNWIERWLDIAPDNGDGTLEWLIVLVVTVLVLVPAALSRSRVRSAVRRFVLSRRRSSYQNIDLAAGSGSN
jgi:hypothetical protein